MKKNCVSALVWAIAAAALLALPAHCPAQDSSDERDSFWAEPEEASRWGEPTDQMINRLMNRLRQDDPEKAEQLEQLRQQDPEKFKIEIREVMRQRFRARHREGIEPNEPGQRPRLRSRRSAEDDRPRKASRGARRPPRPIQERHREFLDWLENNYPDVAKSLAERRETDPENYERRFGLLLRKYHRLFESVRDNPKMADLLKEDFELKQQRDEILRKLRRARDDAARKDLTEQLRQVVNKRFDVIVKRRQMEYEQLLEKLEKLRQQVQKSESEVARWKEPDFKQQSVSTRVEELISAKKEFKWD